MKNGYGQHFNKLKKQKGLPVTNEEPHRAKVSSQNELSDDLQAIIRKGLQEDMAVRRQQVRERMSKRAKQRPSKRISAFGAFFSFVALLLAATVFVYPESIENIKIPKLAVAWFSPAIAEEAAPVVPSAANPPAQSTTKQAGDIADKKTPTEEKIDVTHLQNLVDRKKELDLREQELNRLTEELKSKEEALNERIEKLEKMRKEITEVLAERVERDDKRVDSLVQVYSTMKPSQAAKIFEEMDQDLAIQILGRMKKKNAAEIMNLLPAPKAKLFSEKYAGYLNGPN